MYNDLIDDYLSEVTKDMGAEQRKDVSKELRTHILDSADALAAEKKVPVDDFIVREVISKMGPADKIAAMYPSRETFLEKNGLLKVLPVMGGLAVAFMMVAGILWVVAPDVLAMPISIIFNIVFAMVVAMVVITALFLVIYVYESRLKTPYEARLRRLNKGLQDATSPLKVWLTIAMTAIGLAFIAIVWPYIPFLQGFGPEGVMIPLFTPEFGKFIPFMILLGMFNIAIQILYLAMRQKWVPSLLDVALSCLNALLTAWILAVFPFNTGFMPIIAAGIKVVLVFAIIGCLVDAAKKLWQAAQFFMHGVSSSTAI